MTLTYEQATHLDVPVYDVVLVAPRYCLHQLLDIVTNLGRGVESFRPAMLECMAYHHVESSIRIYVVVLLLLSVMRLLACEPPA